MKSEWHQAEVNEVLRLLEANVAGLSEVEVRSRRERYGPNRLPEPEPASLGRIILRQFASPLISILIFAALVSMWIGDAKDAGFIAVVLSLNAGIGAWQEWKAERSGQALRKLLRIRASVQRGGEIREVPAEELVPGDVVWLESGNHVPADLRLLHERGLETDESLLTGESLPVAKDASWCGAEDAPLGDRANMAYAGSVVTRGRGKGIVVATGGETRVGMLALDVVAAHGGKSPLLLRMERFTRAIAIATLGIAALIGIVGVMAGGRSITDMFLFAVALAVSAIPEGLPVAMTVALAIATTRMARRGVIVRRLTAVEGLGSCTLIATDKTGTLTVNELTVREVRLAGGEVFRATGEGFVPEGEVLVSEEGRPADPGEFPDLDVLARTGVLCNEADLLRRQGEWCWRGDAVDVALLCFGHKLGWRREVTLDALPQVNEIPFESERRFAATFHDAGDAGTRVCVKGAPERVLAMCEAILDRAAMEEVAWEMAGRGLRVIALAEGPADAGAEASRVPGEPSGLRFLGFVGMMDPLRSGVKEAVRQCRSAGVGVTMVTGDHRVTAQAIARDMGMACDDGEMLTGVDLERMSPDELAADVGRVRVFARVGPHQKLEIVDAARAAGHFVAVTGDGVNDAPALRTANIGVAMGRSGTDVAREAADLVISDDNFATIIGGIEEGRVAYDNIRKVIYLLVSTGAAELILMALSVANAMPLPLLPVQILWLNLVTNGIQDVALAFEPSEGDVLDRPPRSPREPIFNRLMLERVSAAAIVGGGLGFGFFSWMIACGWDEPAARNALLLFMVLFEIFHIGNCRSETKSAFVLSPLRSPVLLFGTLIALAVHVVAMHQPFMQDLLGCRPVEFGAWGAIAALALIVIPVMELHKWLWKRRTRG